MAAGKKTNGEGKNFLDGEEKLRLFLKSLHLFCNINLELDLPSEQKCRHG